MKIKYWYWTLMYLTLTLFLLGLVVWGVIRDVRGYIHRCAQTSATIGSDGQPAFMFSPKCEGRARHEVLVRACPRGWHETADGVFRCASR